MNKKGVFVESHKIYGSAEAHNFIMTLNDELAQFLRKKANSFCRLTLEKHWKHYLDWSGLHLMKFHCNLIKILISSICFNCSMTIIYIAQEVRFRSRSIPTMKTTQSESPRTALTDCVKSIIRKTFKFRQFTWVHGGDSVKILIYLIVAPLSVQLSHFQWLYVYLFYFWIQCKIKVRFRLWFSIPKINSFWDI